MFSLISVSKMRVNSCVVGCKSENGGSAERRLFLVPVQPSRRKAWLMAVGRSRTTQNQTTKKANHLYVCSTHFISKAKSNIPGNPDYVPSANLGRHRAIHIAEKCQTLSAKNKRSSKQDMTEEPDYAYELYSSHCASSRLNTISYGEQKLRNRGWMLLEERVDLNFGLLDKLLARGLLNEVQYDDVRASQSTAIGWTKLSEYIHRNSLYDFILAIQITKQQHLLNYAWNSGIYNPKFGGDWPLTDRQMMAINTNQEVLLELMEMSPELIEKLYSRYVLNKRHKDFICGQLSDLKKSETFLEILRRRSFRDYKETIKCLRASNQKHIAQILEGGIVARIFCSVTSSKSCPVNRSTSKAIFERYSKKLKRTPLDKEDCKLQLIKIGLFDAGFDNGVVLYFKCKKKDDFENLEKVFDNGELNTFAEADFYNLLPRDETPITVLLHWTYYDRKRCDTYIRCRPFSDTCINKVPKVVLEIVLTKAYALYFHHVQPRPGDKELFAMLSSVSRDWHRNISRRWFKASLNRRLSPYFLSITKRQTIISSNKQYFVENMEPSSNLIRRLEQVGCLTSEEESHIESLQHDSEKNHELLNIARSLSFKKHFAFIESLHFCCQLKVANVLEQGGVVFKVKVALAGTSTNNEFTQRLNENIFELHREYSELGECKQLLFVKIPTELEILGAQQLGRRGREYVVIWFWCKSQKSLDQLCRLSKSNELLQRLDILITCVWSKSTATLCKLFKGLLQRTLVPQFLQTPIIDTMQFQRKVAVRRLSAIFCGKFYLPPNSRAFTSLDDKIYVLMDHAILVHQYMAPYARQSETVFPPAESPAVYPDNGDENQWFIEPCNQTKRIYVARPYDQRVWRLTTPEYNLEVWMHYNMATLCSLSVTSNEHVLILNAERRANDSEYCLEIFTEDAALVHHVNLGISMNYSSLSSALEISPRNFAINRRRSLIVKTVDFATNIADPNHIQYPYNNNWPDENIESMALYSESRLITLLWNRLAIFDSRLNVEIISESFNERVKALHYRKEKRQAMVWSSESNSVHIYTLQYEGEDFFADDV